MKNRAIKISHCGVCPFRQEIKWTVKRNAGEYKTMQLCDHPYYGKATELTNINEIPNWCPLTAGGEDE